MIESRPSPFYLLLLMPALMLWAFQTPLRVISALAILGLLSLRRFLPGVLKPRPWTFFLGALLVFLVAYFWIYPDSAEIYVVIYSLRQFQALALSMLAMIVLQWFSWRSARFDWLLFSIGLFFLFSTVSPQLMQYKALYLWCVVMLISAVLIVLLVKQGLQKHHEESLRRYYFQQIVWVYLWFWAGALGLIHLAEWMDQRFSEQFSRFLLRQQASWSGFSGNTQLKGNTEIQLSDQVALTLDSPHPLEYLRGAVLTIYDNGRWLPLEAISSPRLWEGPWPQSPPQVLQHYQAVLPGLGLPPRTQGYWVQVKVKGHYQGLIFSPPGLRLAALPRSAPVYQNQYALLRQERSQREHDYWLWVEPGAQPEALLTPEILKENLNISPQLRQILQPLAEQITQGAPSPLDKARRLEQWFQTHFRYSLQVDSLTPGQDPTVDFILQRRPAYCSWFASGMVLMLRSLGIPAHVVSGWRGMEYHALSRVWVVREKQAHDWVEVLDEKRRIWVHFDPTPATQRQAFLVQQDLLGWIQTQLDNLRIFSETWQERIRRWRFQDLLDYSYATIRNIFHSLWFYGSLCLVLVYFFTWRFQRHRHSRSSFPLRYQGGHPRLERIQRRLLQRLAQEGLPIEEHWTLQEMAARWRALHGAENASALEEILQRVSALRFGQNSPSSTALQELEQRLENWIQALNRQARASRTYNKHHSSS